MFSKFTIAAGLALIADLAFANPVRRDAISKRQVMIEKDPVAPSYCRVIGNESGALLYRFLDVSKGKSFCNLLCLYSRLILFADCMNAGLGDQCCITVMTQGPDRILSERDRNDLMAAIAGQSKKDGRFDRTTYGDWSATFDQTVFSSNDLVHPEILQVWFHYIKNLDLSTTAGFGNVILQIRGGTDDISNYMLIKRKW